MTAFYQDFVLCSGDDRTLRFTITDDVGAVVDLGGVQSARWGCARLLANGSYVLPAVISKTLQTGAASPMPPPVLSRWRWNPTTPRRWPPAATTTSCK